MDEDTFLSSLNPKFMLVSSRALQALRPSLIAFLVVNAQTLSLWLGMLINGCLAALLSALIFAGLEHTMVTNAVLLGRLGPILFALAGAVIWGKPIIKAEWIGFSFILVGILAIVLVSNNWQINIGDLYIIASAFLTTPRAKATGNPRREFQHFW
ncbi:MAG: EamA family transporter [Leptolyngbya sp. SIOISBB]|nr:EamA family transporter [Leptolyngbya sp. SIOISBB]